MSGETVYVVVQPYVDGIRQATTHLGSLDADVSFPVAPNEERPGTLRVVCGITSERFDGSGLVRPGLAEAMAEVTCPDCRQFADVEGDK